MLNTILRVHNAKAKLIRLTAVIVLSAVSTQALAWGETGHKIVAKIAEHYLTDTARARIQQMLAEDQQKQFYARECPHAKTTAEFLMCVSTWADRIRNDRPETANWHFVDIPNVPPRGTASRYSQARDCPCTRDGDCVVAAIEQFRTLLATKTNAGDRGHQRRIEALKFIVHFVGDLHQPLHSADNRDRGGNEVKVFWQGAEYSNGQRKYEWNLHAVWDTGIIEETTKDADDYASRLVEILESGIIGPMQQGSVVDWANETHRIAVRSAYSNRYFQKQRIGENGKPKADLGPDYLKASKPVVDDQLMKAGVRLARVLNEALDD